ncbi:hypothetical protein HYT57_01685 [Candidatus Woesearchaeota archaeon]|nr:hypothetical protein [Candidatus Woesearchaeota archaeon]
MVNGLLKATIVTMGTFIGFGVYYDSKVRESSKYVTFGEISVGKSFEQSSVNFYRHYLGLADFFGYDIPVADVLTETPPFNNFPRVYLDLFFLNGKIEAYGIQEHDNARYFVDGTIAEAAVEFYQKIGLLPEGQIELNYFQLSRAQETFDKYLEEILRAKNN